MAKKYSRKVTKKRIFKLNPRDAQDIIEKEFSDSRGNRIRFRHDFRPHPIDEPTIEWQRKYNKER